MNKNIIYILIAIAIIAIIGYGIMKSGGNKEISNPKSKTVTTEESSPKEDKEGSEMMSLAQTEIDLDESIVNWQAKKTLVTTNDHNGTVNFKSGFVTIEDEMITGGELTIDMPSLITTDLTGALKEKLETHLKSDDFFGTATFPTSKFTIKKVDPLEGSQFMIVGDLTIKGITNEISFSADILSDDKAFTSTADLEIDRSLWDIRFGSGKFFDDLGNNLIDDTIKFSLEVSVPRK